MIFLFSISLFSQTVNEEQKPFVYLEEMPVFPGGESELLKFFSKNIKYPKINIENSLQLKIVVRFIVLEDGSIGNIEIVKGINTELENEVIRVVKLLPKFNPGKQNGKPVKVYYNLPFNFEVG